MNDKTRVPPAAAATASPWWERPGLGYRESRLLLDGHDVEAIARAENRPVFIYSSSRVRANLERLHAALSSQPLPFRVFYAIKSNRFAPLLTFMRALGLCGVDVCSPGELLHVLRLGFAERDISYTSITPSDADLAVLEQHPGIWINCDSIAAVRRLGERCPGRTIGLRINPGLGIGYRTNRLLQYSGDRPTKFGIYRTAFLEALETAAKHRLRVRGLHLHCGCGYLTPQLAVLDDILSTADWFIRQAGDLQHVNIGGGLGIPLVEDDEPLDLAAWNAVVQRHLGGRSFEIWLEPGDYIVKDSGMLVLQVVAVEEKERTRFVFVDGGFNLHIEPAFYQLPLHPLPCRATPGRRMDLVTIAGNINEALDIFATGVQLTAVREGEYLAMLNAGGYGSSMSSNHCMRGEFTEYLIG